MLDRNTTVGSSSGTSLLVVTHKIKTRVKGCTVEYQCHIDTNGAAQNHDNNPNCNFLFSVISTTVVPQQCYTTLVCNSHFTILFMGWIYNKM